MVQSSNMISHKIRLGTWYTLNNNGVPFVSSWHFFFMQRKKIKITFTFSPLLKMFRPGGSWRGFIWTSISGCSTCLCSGKIFAYHAYMLICLHYDLEKWFDMEILLFSCSCSLLVLGIKWKWPFWTLHPSFQTICSHFYLSVYYKETSIIIFCTNATYFFGGEPNFVSGMEYIKAELFRCGGFAWDPHNTWRVNISFSGQETSRSQILIHMSLPGGSRHPNIMGDPKTKWTIMIWKLWYFSFATRERLFHGWQSQFSGSAMCPTLANHLAGDCRELAEAGDDGQQDGGGGDDGQDGGRRRHRPQSSHHLHVSASNERP